jgi:hypothetical protein
MEDDVMRRYVAMYMYHWRENDNRTPDRIENGATTGVDHETLQKDGT